jgi:hypothetical protein
MNVSAEEGALGFLVTPVSGWPPESESELCKAEDGDTSAEVRVACDGELELEVTDGEEVTTSFKSSPVEIPDGTNIMVFIRWGEDGASISINGEEVPPTDAKRTSPHVVESESVQEQRAIGHSDAEVRCEKWIGRRKEEWGKPNDSRLPDGEGDPRMLKSRSEQKGDLMRATSILMDDLQLVAEGELYRLDVVLATLRSLLCWKGNHDPLLLRVASWEDLPLPVFSIDQSGLAQEMTEKLEEIAPDSSFYFGMGGVSVRKRTPGHEIVDLQEWLDQPVIKGTDARNSVKNRDLIREHASTSSLSHYHEYIYQEADLSRNLSLFDKDQLTDYFFETGKATAELGRYVIERVA